MNKHIRTQINGSLKTGWQVAFDNDAPALVTVNADYSGIICTTCQQGACEHVQAVRECGFYPSQPEIDELWLHRLPVVAAGLRYVVVRRAVGNVETLFLTDPRRFRAAHRRGRVTEVQLVQDDSEGLLPVAVLYLICERYQPNQNGGVSYITETVTHKLPPTDVKQLVAAHRATVNAG